MIALSKRPYAAQLAKKNAQRKAAEPSARLDSLEGVILEQLDKQGCAAPPHELQAELQLSPRMLAPRLKGLARLGFVRLARTPEQGVTVELTETGRDVVAAEKLFKSIAER